MIELEDASPPPPKPRLPGVVVVRATPDGVLDAAAADFLVQANNCVRSFGDFHLAISMTGTEALLRRLMYDPALRDLPWKRTHLWMVDEWDVPADDPRRLFPLLQQLVVDPSDIPPGQVHAIPVAADAAGSGGRGEESPAAAYEAMLREVLGWREKGHDRLDCVLLGGPGSASVQPFQETNTGTLRTEHPAPGADDDVPHAGERLVRVLPGRSLAADVDLVTMTARMLRGSRLVSVVAMGAEHRGLVERASQAPRGPRRGESDDAAREFPRSGLVPLAGELRWYLDAEACPVLDARPESGPGTSDQP